MPSTLFPLEGDCKLTNIKRPGVIYIEWLLAAQPVAQVFMFPTIQLPVFLAAQLLMTLPEASSNAYVFASLLFLVADFGMLGNDPAQEGKSFM